MGPTSALDAFEGVCHGHKDKVSWKEGIEATTIEDLLKDPRLSETIRAEGHGTKFQKIKETCEQDRYHVFG